MFVECEVSSPHFYFGFSSLLLDWNVQEFPSVCFTEDVIWRSDRRVYSVYRDVRCNMT